MRSGASHPGPHQTWVPAPCLSHRGSGAVTASARQPSQRVPHVCRSRCRCMVLQPRIRNCCVAGGPSCLQASRGRRPQCPGNQFRARAQFLEVFSPAIRFRQSPAATGLPQSSSKLRNSHVSLHTLSSKLLAPSNTKTAPDCEETVDDETSLWNREEN